MNIFKKLYCRTYQFVFKALLPILPYREPELLKNNDDIVKVLKSKNITSVLLVTDKGIRGLGLTKSLEEALTQNQFKLVVFDKTVPNPTTDNVEEALEMYKQHNCNCLCIIPIFVYC